MLAERVVDPPKGEGKEVVLVREVLLGRESVWGQRGGEMLTTWSSTVCSYLQLPICRLNDEMKQGR